MKIASYALKTVLGAAAAVMICASFSNAFALNGNEEVYEETDIQSQIEYELEKYDFSKWDAFFDELPNGITEILGTDARHTVEKYAYTDGAADGEKNVAAVKDICLQAIAENTVPIAKILALAILSGLASFASAGGKENGNESIISFICTGICVLLLLNEIRRVTQSAEAAVNLLSEFSEVSMPILTTLIAAVGSVGTSGTLSPLAAFLNSFVVGVFKNTVLPLTLAMAAISAVNAMSGDDALKHLLTFIKTALKWLIGLTFTVYMGMLSVQGIAAANVDSIAVKSVKFALDKSVPVVGSVVSGTLSTVVSCASMIKNAAGLSAVLIAAANLLMPLLNIGGMTIALRMCAAMCESVFDRRICKLLSSLASVCNYLFAAVVSVGIMFMITLGICIMIGG